MHEGLTAFVGRERELLQLDGAIAAAVAGGTAAVLVVGEAGIGKSTLVQHAGAEAGVGIVVGRASQGSAQTIPLASLADLLRSVHRRYPELLDAEDLAPRAQLVGRLRPDLGAGSSSLEIFDAIGAAPRTDWLPHAVRRDDWGYIATGAQCTCHVSSDAPRAPLTFETTMPGVFAVGDVRQGSVKRVALQPAKGRSASDSSTSISTRFLSEPKPVLARPRRTCREPSGQLRVRRPDLGLPSARRTAASTPDAPATRPGRSPGRRSRTQRSSRPCSSRSP